MYEDIINLPHQVSQKHRHMTPDERAVQFAPFAALPGYRELIEETMRTTEERRELSDDRKVEIGRQLAEITGQNVSIRYFVPDPRKPGGAYHTACGIVQSVSAGKQKLTMADGTVIPFEDISEIEQL